MGFEKHAEYRAWAFSALDDLETFLDDPDFEGEAETERTGIHRRRVELREGKYRVVFLGPFNVGKSALINALLGDEYLPTVLEECTTKLTRVVRGEEMKAVLRVAAEPLAAEIDALRGLLKTCAPGASISVCPAGETPRDAEGWNVVIAFGSISPKHLLRTLRALVTMIADEDFPQLRALRDRFDEIVVSLPNVMIEEDIALLDTPGVHSVIETKQRIAEDILPQSHLIVYMVDSQNAGNQQNRDFIETVVKMRRRKVFFVINKSDQLNPEEIDITGRRGPAKDLVRSLTGIVDRPELFFISSLYALVAAQLAQNRIGLEDLDNNNKIKIPFRVQMELLRNEGPAKAIADYLFRQSNIETLKHRLLEYLYRENREGAIVESVCRFLDDRAWTYLRPVAARLELAKDNPELEELKQRLGRLKTDLEQNEGNARVVTDRFSARAAGGAIDGVECMGYESAMEACLGHASVEEKVLKPLRAWMANDTNVKQARKKHFDPLAAEIENALDAFLAEATQTVNAAVSGAENEAIVQMGRVAEGLPETWEPLQVARGSLGGVHAGMLKTYVGYMAVGAGIGAGAMAALCVWGGVGPSISSWVEQQALLRAFVTNITATTLATAAGGVAGLLGGLLARAFTAKRALRRKLRTLVEKKVGVMTGAVREQLKGRLCERCEAFADWIKRAFDKSVTDLSNEIEKVSGEIDVLRRELDIIIDRLEPKVERLTALREQACTIAEASAPVASEE